MASQRILVVEDERELAEALKFNLDRQGYETIVVGDGFDAVAQVERGGIDAMVLDVMLPGLDGFEVCRRVRQVSNIPILMLTARADEVDRVIGLEIGADDYLTKPFGLRELLARVRALLRRSATDQSFDPQASVSGDIRISERERRVWRDDRELALRPREYDLLRFLLHHPRQALSRQQILDGAWGVDYIGDERTVDVHIRALREQIEDDPSQPTRITTVRGVGYRYDG